MLYLYLKALHIIFVVTWFAGLFYIVRLFIYHVETRQKTEEEKRVLVPQYKLMTSRLWNIITVPSMWLTLATGLYLLYESRFYTQEWMIIKLGLLAGLLLYHFACGMIRRQLLVDVIKYTSHQLRMWNEVATLFLFSIVFIVVLKNGLDMVVGLTGLVILSLLMMVGVRYYRNYRKRKGED